MNVLIPVRITAAQMQHVLILVVAIAVYTCDRDYTGDGISCKGVMCSYVNSRLFWCNCFFFDFDSTTKMIIFTVIDTIPITHCWSVQ